MASLKDISVPPGNAKKKAPSKGEIALENALRQISSAWKGSDLTAARNAAYDIGELVAGGLLAHYKGDEFWKRRFAVQLTDDKWWSTVHESFQSGRSSLVTMSDLLDKYSSVAANDNQRFSVTWFDEVNKSPAKEEIVKGVIGAGEFSLWVAKPGTAKSVLLCDIGCHIAAGIDWHGRKVKQGLVVFFAAERKGLTERRIAAWRKKYDLSGLPFAVVGGKLDMTSNPIDAKALSATIKVCEEKAGLPCRLVVIDTVTRTFGPGDQNSSKDMQRYIQSADELTRATGSHVAVIHHSGWAGDRGKGAIDLDGAVDVSYGISVMGKGPTKVFKLECTGANDGDEGVITSFRLDSVELGTDADGNLTDAPVVVQMDGTKHDGSNLRGHTGKVYDSLERAVEAHGECPPDGAPGFPSGVVTVSRDQWRDQYYADTRAKEPNLAEHSLRQRLLRARGELEKAGKIAMTGERCWITAT